MYHHALILCRKTSTLINEINETDLTNSIDEKRSQDVQHRD